MQNTNKNQRKKILSSQVSCQLPKHYIRYCTLLRDSIKLENQTDFQDGEKVNLNYLILGLLRESPTKTKADAEKKNKGCKYLERTDVEC